MSERLALPIVPLVRVGDHLYLSGQVAFATWGVIVEGGIEEQARQTMENIGAALAAEGAVFDDIVKLNVWLTRAEDFSAFNRVYGSFFKNGIVPARTTVVSDLAIPKSLIEIDGLAVMGRSSATSRG